MVIWITGLSGSGKTTLARAIGEVVKPALPQLVVLDGDVIRAAVADGLGHAEADRMVQIRRIQGLAKALADQGLVVVVAALYAHPDLLRWNRDNLQPYFEVYLDASLDLVRRRDHNGLYAKADAGETGDVVGVDIAWHAPEHPDLVIEASDQVAPGVLARRVIEAVPVLRDAARTRGDA